MSMAGFGKEDDPMARLLLRTDLANATDSGLDNHDENQVAQVATEAYARIVEAWKIDDSVAREMISVDPQTWMQIKNGTWNGSLDQEQLMRISAVIGLYDALHSYFNDDLADRWVTMPNKGPMFSGRKPVDIMSDGGLPMMIKTRHYSDALLGGV